MQKRHFNQKRLNFVICLVMCLVFLLFCRPVYAQESIQNLNLTFPQSNTEQSPVIPGMTPFSDPLNPQNQNQKVGEELLLNARLTDDGENIKNGLVWQIYEPVLGVDNKLSLVAEFAGGSAHFNLIPGSYIVHVGFGRADAIRRITLNEGDPLSENFVLNAGGLQLYATMPEGKINEQNLSFTIYSDGSENNDNALVLSGVKSGDVTRLKAGTYHIVSNYGSANAISRTDVPVDAGKITEASVQHHAAQVTLKLIRQEGGEALADTSWSITNDSGDIVRETVGAYTSLILAEGDYLAIAKNKDQLYQKAFSVTSGHDENIDILANSQNLQQFDESID
ncbi:hypothetical protein [Bartonella tamiae]|uniref:Uncharacterized protein n=1 Tax=Bartonella tamiae Th239 TaxID=1094558 RepID=J0R039_9HYPH|nr:hypothetical protein [Bartonella tamiae]EJF88869.1 hypothetical protein ME5_01420 [Bartonella tamiae Th239]EJF94881.1 hypothetical protein MEG_00462 [Bartonella tamiae Th307]